MSTATTIQVHDFYRSNNLRVHEIGKGTKAPKAIGWPSAERYADDIADFLDGERFNKYGWLLDDNHVVIDIDVHDEKENGYESLEKLENEIGFKLVDVCKAVVETPSGGRHYYFTKPPNVKFGKVFADRYPAIDFIHGRGKQVIAANSHHDNHPGKCYELADGAELVEIPDVLSCHLLTIKEPEPSKAPGQPVSDGERSGDEFNTSVRGLELLLGEMRSQGYLVRDHGDHYEFDRPGKTTESGRSGFVGKRSKRGNYLLCCFSLSDSVFPTNESMTIFKAYSLLCCGGDFRKTSSQLYDRGFAANDDSAVDLSLLDSASTGEASPSNSPKVEPLQRFKPFPVHKLPAPLDALVREGANAIGCDESFIALPLMSCVGAAIGNTTRLVVKKGWSVPPAVWTMIVGESGTAKSPAFKVAKASIQRHQKNLLVQHAAQLAEFEVEMEAYKAAKKASKDSKSESMLSRPEYPTPIRCMVSDTTVEALAPILSQNPRGLLLQRDELNGWLGSFNQYKSAKGADESHWLSMFDGESITVDRKGEGTRPTYVETALVSITGGIQPAILAESMSKEHRASGMASRFLIASPPRRSQVWTDDEISQATQLQADRLFVLLLEIGFADGESQPHFVGMSSDAKQAFQAFFNEHHAELVDLSGDSAAAWSKLLGYVPRLALIFHIVKQVNRGGNITDAVDLETIEDAIEMIQWFKQEASRLYATIDDTDDQRELREYVDWIDRKHGGECTPRQMVQGIKHIKTVAEAESEMNRLAKAGLGEWDSSDRKKRVFRTL